MSATTVQPITARLAVPSQPPAPWPTVGTQSTREKPRMMKMPPKMSKPARPFLGPVSFFMVTRQMTKQRAARPAQM